MENQPPPPPPPPPPPRPGRGRLALGIFLIVGVLLTGGLRLAGVRPVPANSSGFSQGGDIGWWVGSAVGLVIGVVLVAGALRARKG